MGQPNPTIPHSAVSTIDSSRDLLAPILSIMTLPSSMPMPMIVVAVVYNRPPCASVMPNSSVINVISDGIIRLNCARKNDMKKWNTM